MNDARIAEAKGRIEALFTKEHGGALTFRWSVCLPGERKPRASVRVGLAYVEVQTERGGKPVGYPRGVQGEELSSVFEAIEFNARIRVEGPDGKAAKQAAAYQAAQKPRHESNWSDADRKPGR